MPVAEPDAIDRATTELGELARLNEPLAPFTTYKVGGCADLFVNVVDPADLHRVAAARRSSGLPVLIPGYRSLVPAPSAKVHW